MTALVEMKKKKTSCLFIGIFLWPVDENQGIDGSSHREDHTAACDIMKAITVTLTLTLALTHLSNQKGLL